MPQLSFKADYAACGGARTLRSLPGPESDSGPVLNQYVWSHRDFANGLFFQGSAIRIAQITDGLSTTYMVGEKCVSTELAVHADDRDFGNDQAALIGDDHDVRRVASVRPYRSSHHRSPESFGSFHSGGWFALYADGSVSEMSFEIDLKIHQSRAGRDDGHASQL